MNSNQRHYSGQIYVQAYRFDSSSKPLDKIDFKMVYDNFD
jgi:hypothetical protein